MALIIIQPQYTPPQIPDKYDPSWLRQQLRFIAAALLHNNISTKTAAYTVKATDNDGTVLVDCTSGAVSITLPPVAQSLNLRVTIKKIDASANAVTVVGTVDGTVNPTLSSQYSATTVHCNGTAYYKLGGV